MCLGVGRLEVGIVLVVEGSKVVERSNADYYPCVTECAYLQENGFGKKIVEFKLNWSTTRIQRYICEIYSRVQLESVGFRFGKCARDQRIALLAVDTLEELLNEVPRGTIIIIPNRDLSCSDYTITDDASVDMLYENSSIEELRHNRHSRRIRRQTQLNSR
ncbi:PREDICTED: uncharacterized protein LOC108783045 [Cyphomyrmex costatus]|uniref:uncharacterized protein LOC108783045 n=1 Tax=Cyphomyrmex costatus TaxID=456900 RepID=UPI000852326E|nr:PREDICTED: uncharacterized protein LOC108783045 [Cyphomyrmex costatus]